VWIDPPRRARQALNGALSLSGLTSRSLQEALTWSPEASRRLRALVDECRPTLVVLDTIRAGQYFESPKDGELRVLYMDDLFHLRFRRLLDVASNGDASIDPAGTFAPMLPPMARAVMRVPAVRDMLYRIEMRKVEAREVEAPGRFDRCLLINPNEAATLRARSGRDNVHASRPLLFPRDCTARREFAGAPQFLMFGSLRHPVYRASVLHFLRTCAEAIGREMPDACIHLVGGGADEEVRALCRDRAPRIEIHGFVPDAMPYFTRSCALLVPLAAAGGLKVKVLTALYYGLPILATDAALDGIPLLDGVSCVRENDVARFPAHMRRLCDAAFNERLSRNSMQAFREHYSRQAVFTEYDALFDAAIPPASRNPLRAQDPVHA
ncbi:MAG TPA: glycosyltransferase family 4 protein, partial [Usitatibacter sp.]|nr:glycosyltransferase family 4 protein [Usitatibacter sp.]